MVNGKQQSLLKSKPNYIQQSELPQTEVQQRISSSKPDQIKQIMSQLGNQPSVTELAEKLTSVSASPEHLHRLTQEMNKKYGNHLVNKAIKQAQSISHSVVQTNLTLDTVGVPYAKMTKDGRLWNSPYFADNTATVGKTGVDYFKFLSEKNRKAVEVEVKIYQSSFQAWMNNDKWKKPFYEKVEKELNNTYLVHYTTLEKASKIAGGSQSLKSLDQLISEGESIQHNTQSFDQYGLANTGFVFFFIEHGNNQFRSTRFGGSSSQNTKDSLPPDSASARFRIPIQESGLLDRGWVMLADLAQQEFPSIYAKPNSGEYSSWLDSRSEDAKPEFKEAVRVKSAEVLDDNFEFPKRIDEKEIPDQDKREGFYAADKLIALGNLNQLSYNKKEHFKQPLTQSILYGKDIIPGIAARATLELARIKAGNPQVFQSMVNKEGADLIRLITKDLFRPQALIPNSVPVKDEYLEIETPKN